jgi:hypothetical protein
MLHELQPLAQHGTAASIRALNWQFGGLQAVTAGCRPDFLGTSAWSQPREASLRLARGALMDRRFSSSNEITLVRRRVAYLSSFPDPRWSLSAPRPEIRVSDCFEAAEEATAVTPSDLRVDYSDCLWILRESTVCGNWFVSGVS